MKSNILCIAFLLSFSHIAFATGIKSENTTPDVNKIFGFVLGGNTIDVLKDISTRQTVKLKGALDCTISKCEIPLFLQESSADFVFSDKLHELSKRYEHDLLLPQTLKNKSDISRLDALPSAEQVGVTVVKVEVGEKPTSHYIIYSKENILIAIRPVDFFGRELPIERKELIKILNDKYVKEKTLLSKTEKTSKFHISNTVLTRWKMNEEVEIRLFSYDSKITNYTQCMTETRSFSILLDRNLCTTSNQRVLMYVYKPAFDLLNGEILRKIDENEDVIWKKYLAKKNKF